MSATTSRLAGVVVQLVPEGRVVVPVPDGTAAGGVRGGTQSELAFGISLDHGADAT